MSTPQHLRITTADPRSAKRDRVLLALKDPANFDLPNRQLARALSVDEKMIRKFKKLLTPRAGARKPRGKG